MVKVKKKNKEVITIKIRIVVILGRREEIMTGKGHSRDWRILAIFFT